MVDQLESLDDVFHALANSARRDMLNRLAEHPLTVGELAQPLTISLAATSKHIKVLERAGLVVERVYKVKEGRPNVVDLIKGERIQLIVNTPHGQDTFFDEKAIRRAAVTQRISTITTIAAARAAAAGRAQAGKAQEEG